MEAYPSLLLGAIELTPFEVASLYQVLATGGFRTPLRAIREVVAADGQPLQRYQITSRQVADPGAVYLLTRAMQRVITSGTGRGLLQKVSPHLELAGKTGTSNDKRDSWFAAFSGDLLGVVWLGRDDNAPAGLSGSSGALRIYGDAAKEIGLSPLESIPPESVVTVWVDGLNGGRASPECRGAEPVPFLGGHAPREISPCLGAEPARVINDRFSGTNR
jgi:penicillin-binding protein 1B